MFLAALTSVRLRHEADVVTRVLKWMFGAPMANVHHHETAQGPLPGVIEKIPKEVFGRIIFGCLLRRYRDSGKVLVRCA